MITIDEQPGKTLRERRASLGLSIDEVADKTRIRREFLVALESDDYDKLPGAAYVTGFLRNYAEFLNLNGNQLVNVYQTRKNGPIEVDVPPPTKQPSPRRGIHFGVIAITGLLLISYWIVTSQPNAVPQKKVPDVTIAPASQQQDQIIPPKQPDETPTAPPQPKPPAPLNISFNQRAVIQLRAQAATQVVLSIDGRSEQQYAVSEGTVLRWKVSDQARIHIADNNQIQLYLNKELIPLDDNNEIILSRATN